MLGLTGRDLKQTRFYQEMFAEGKQGGELKGWQKGRQEGRQEEGSWGLLTGFKRLGLVAFTGAAGDSLRLQG